MYTYTMYTYVVLVKHEGGMRRVFLGQLPEYGNMSIIKYAKGKIFISIQKRDRLEIGT